MSDRELAGLVDELSRVTNSTPPPGATPDDLAAAESRMGRALTPQHRDFLLIADGWTEFDGYKTILSASQLGQGEVWELLEESTHEVLAVTPELSPGPVTSPDQLIPFAFTEATSDYVAIRAGEDTTVYELPGVATYPDLKAYLQSEIDLRRGNSAE